jgi:K+-sensing histidine kinase KdpD
MTSDIAVPSDPPEWRGADSSLAQPTRSSPVIGYGLSLLLVAAATIVAFVVDHIVPASNLSLVFVLPVIVAALNFGWGPALLSAVLGVGLVDFLFIEPRLTLLVSSPSDLWSLSLLLVVAALASTVGAQSRGRAIAALRAARQAEALQTLAHAVIAAEPQVVLIRVAASTLGDIFSAPAVVLAEQAGKLQPAALSGGAKLSAADLEAAHWALANDKPTRAQTYPFDQAEFDFWPVQRSANQRLVLGVKLTGRADGRPDVPDRHVELVAGYLAAAAG